MFTNYIKGLLQMVLDTCQFIKNTRHYDIIIAAANAVDKRDTLTKRDAEMRQ